jgi:DNA-binding LacI/PurR family transcriptional regulator
VADSVSARTPDAGRPRRASLKDVARVAGVSAMTASRVANGGPGVGDETRSRVLRVMAELDFVPNATARALKTGRAPALGYLALASQMQGSLLRTLESVEHTAREHGYGLMVASFPTIDADTVRLAQAQFQRDAVDAVIAISPLNESAEALALIAERIPTVGLWTPAGPVESIAADDNELGAQLATEHLLSLGHETVWHIAGPRGWMATDHRLAGWRRALEAAGRPVPEPRHAEHPLWSAEAGFTEAMTLLADPDVTAVFAADDRMALGTLHAAARLGRAVPGDVSVVGYDDIPESGFYLPSLTTVHEEFELLGEAAVHAALARIGRDVSRERRPIEPWLVTRATTAPPAR